MDLYNQDKDELLNWLKKQTPEDRNTIIKAMTDSEYGSKIRKEAEDILYFYPPPTPREFLNPDCHFLDKRLIEGYFDYVKNDFYEVMENNSKYSGITLYGGTRCEAKDTEVLMYDLSIKKIQDVKVGDLLMGIDSTPRTVLETVKGFGDLYKVKQNKADDYIVNEDHKLVLQFTSFNNKYSRVATNSERTIEISVKDYLKLSKKRKHFLKGLKTKLDFPYKETKLDPYYLGLFLGDGTTRSGDITTMDSEVVDFIYQYASTLGLQVTEKTKSRDNKAKTYSITQGKFRTHKAKPLLHILREENLLQNKHIPLNYIRNSREVRLQLLSGLIDSDGSLYYSSRNKSRAVGYQIMQKSDILTKDILLLCRSLGLRANSKKVKKTIKSINFEGWYNSIQVTGKIEDIPCKIDRKKIKYIPNIKRARPNPLRTGIRVDYYGKGEFYGFALDGDRKYLQPDLTVKRNTGKSVASRLITVFTTVKLSYLRDITLFYNILSASLPSIYAVSFKDDKIAELITNPIEKILINSPRFKKEKFKDQVRLKGVSTEGVIHYSSASDFAAFTFPAFNIVAGRDPSEFVGADIIAAIISELTFYKEYAGATDEEVLEVYSKLRNRISGTIGEGHDVGNFVILDGSARDADSPLEKMILNEHVTDDKIFYRRYATPQIRPYLYPRWNKDPNDPENYFEVVTGDADNPAFIVDKDPIKRSVQLKDIPDNLVKKAPIDRLKDFEIDLIGSIRDVLGCPTSKESRFIQKASLINDIFNNETLTNIESNIIVDSSVEDPLFLFNKIKDEFLIDMNNDSYYFRRAKNEPRYIGFDLADSTKGDVTGFCIMHKEWSKVEKKIMYIVDMAFAVAPGMNGISLKSIPDLIIQIFKSCNVTIRNIAVDTYQSKFAVQLLSHINNLPVESHSTVKDLNCWIDLSTLLHNQSLKAGKNIYIKNNLKSLIRVKSKSDKEQINHEIGSKNDNYHGDWEEATTGKNANDVIDAVVQAMYVAMNDAYVPTTSYEDENDLVLRLKNTDYTEDEISEAFDINKMAQTLRK